MLVLAWILPVLWPGNASAQTVHVAVAANFKKSFQELAKIFEAQTQHHILISSGSTGKLYAQIINGAPFQVFLSADQQRPRLLAESGLALGTSRFTYALGRLALWTPKGRKHGSGQDYLLAKTPAIIALPNPKVAPYGKAAKQVMQSIGAWNLYQGRMAFGENVGQAMAFVASGSVEAGFVALSQILALDPKPKQIWTVPQNHYSPLRQDAILLTQAQSSPGAVALLAFLKSAATLEKIKQMGYGAP
jgi:molybdate transport system substrate-binding protein